MPLTDNRHRNARGPAVPGAEAPTKGISRRNLLTGAGALTLAGAFGLEAAAPRRAAAKVTPQLPRVYPLSAQAVQDGYGVCVHPTFLQSAYRHSDSVIQRLEAANVRWIRGMYGAARNSGSVATTASCRARGVKWLAPVIPSAETTQAEIEAKVAHMAATAADVVGAVEGRNEPNDGDAAIWVPRAVQQQRWLYEAVRSHPELEHVLVLGPSMHDIRLDRSGGAHWQLVVDAGIRSWMDVAAAHCYPAANLPGTKRDVRLQWIYDAFGAGYPVWFSEWGYTNTLGRPRTGGHKVMPAELSAVYDAQAVFDFANHGHRFFRYEALDDPDPSNTDTESNFGLWRVQSVDGDPDSTWTPKPAVAALTSILGWLADPGPAYVPESRRLQIESDSPIGSSLVAKRTGETRLYLWRQEPIWDPVAEEPTPVDTVPVKVRVPRRERTVQVGPSPVSVDPVTL